MRATDIASELVRIPSVNPDGGDPGTDHTGEAACARWIASFLDCCGTAAELREVFPGRPNVVARFRADSPGKPRLLFAPHTDTVSVAGMTIDPFGGEIRDGRLWGRGASDTKGPMASMLWALREAGSEIASLPYEIWFAGLVGEEAGQFGAKALSQQEVFDFVIAGEPTDLNVVHAHKGSVWATLRTHGRSVHASRPETGENAIYKMSEAVDCIRKEIVPALAAQCDPVLGSPTISVGTIRGGSKVNIVPDFCEAVVDMRTIPGQDLTTFESLLRHRLPDIEISISSSAPLLTDPAHPLIKSLQSCGAKLAAAPWFCDAAVFALRGAAAVACGPGNIAQAHTADEFIAVDDIEKGGQFFLRFLRSLA